MRISIITPVLNAEKHIGECLKSVSEQIYSHIEHLIIDGCSTDNTLELVQDFARSHPHVRYISEKDNGIYDAMNKGIHNATGEYLLFLGADDRLYNKHSLLHFVEALKEETIFAYGQTFFMNTTKVLGHEVNLHFFIRNNICHQSILYHKDLFARFGLFSTNYTIWSDYIFNLTCFKHLEQNDFQYIPVVLAKFNETGISQVSQDKAFIRDRWLLTKFILGRQFQEEALRKEISLLLSWCLHFNMIHSSIPMGIRLSIIKALKDQSIKPLKNCLHLLYQRLTQQ